MLRADEQVFKLNDSRVKALSTGKLTVAALAYTIKPGDYMILYKNTVYALTEDQYYAAQQMDMQKYLTKEAFQQVLKQDIDKLDTVDRKAAQRIKNSKTNCSTCQYNSYKTQLLRIMQKYPWLLSKYNLVKVKRQIRQYPQVSQPVVSKVSALFPTFFQKVEYDRKPCLDCVQKHIGMAYIKGCQAQQGYPEHLVLAVANLQEAYEECPKDCSAVREMLLFCIGKTKIENKAFIPLDNLLYLIQMARQETGMPQALDKNKADQSFDLQLDQQMKQELAEIPVLKKLDIMNELKALIALEYSNKDHISVKYQGYMGSLADMILPFSVKVSNLLRNRRLMFKACPQLVRQTEYDCKDLQEALKSPTAKKD